MGIGPVTMVDWDGVNLITGPSISLRPFHYSQRTCYAISSTGDVLATRPLVLTSAMILPGGTDGAARHWTIEPGKPQTFPGARSKSRSCRFAVCTRNVLDFAGYALSGTEIACAVCGTEIGSG
eukprot:2534343-Rhodomonas_salina.4